LPEKVFWRFEQESCRDFSTSQPAAEGIDFIDDIFIDLILDLNKAG